MSEKAPISALTLTGTRINTAEAVMTRKSIMVLSAVDLKEIHSDLSQLPD